MTVGCSDDSALTDIPPHLNISDSLTLVNIYNAIGPWSNEWDLSDVSTWKGVTTKLDTVHNEYRVVSFDAGGYFHGNFPHEICQLSELRKLSVYGYNLEGCLPPNIGKLKHLEELFVEVESMSGCIPENIGELTNLEYLTIQNSHIGGPLPPSIGNLANLKRLCISHTDVSGTIPKEIANLDKLYYAVLNNNFLNGTFPVEILKGKKVQFQCQDNIITELPFEVWDDSFDGVPPCLQGNYLSGEIPLWVKKTDKWKKHSYCVDNQRKGYGYNNY